MKRKLVAAAVILAGITLMQNCSSGKKITAPVAAVSFDKDVLPVMQNSCTPCHFPPDGRKEPLNTYDAVKNNIGHILERVKLPQNDIKFMPFKNKKPALTDSVINVLVLWEKQGMSK